MQHAIDVMKNSILGDARSLLPLWQQGCLSFVMRFELFERPVGDVVEAGLAAFVAIPWYKLSLFQKVE